MKKNGSPEPRFNTDDDRTFFEVELFIHPAFKSKQPFTIDLSTVQWNLAGINELLNQILEYAEINEASDIVGDMTDGINNADNQGTTIVTSIDNDIAGGMDRIHYNTKRQADNRTFKTPVTIAVGRN